MKEIAEKMNLSGENAAKTQNYKCKQKLMDMLKNSPDVTQYFKMQSE
jgi:DNA polymerase/3'-5' exonuclease PolX